MFRAVLIIAASFATASAQPPVEILEGVSSSLNDYNFSPDARGRRAVFARSEADFAKARIFETERHRGGWTEPRPIAFTDQRFSDSDPWLTPDGQTLYFISNRPVAGSEAKKDLDIWRSRRTGHGWSAPEHLAALSSPGPELGVEEHGGRIYFSSARPGGKGGLDIYSAPILKQGFGVPELLDGPFNSTVSDSDFTLSADGKVALFWRSSDGRKANLYRSERAEDGWSEPEPLPQTINRGDFNFTPALSRDGRTLWFASTARRPGQPEGMADIFTARLR